MYAPVLHGVKEGISRAEDGGFRVHEDVKVFSPTQEPLKFGELGEPRLIPNNYS